MPESIVPSDGITIYVSGFVKWGDVRILHDELSREAESLTDAARRHAESEHARWMADHYQRRNPEGKAKCLT